MYKYIALAAIAMATASAQAAEPVFTPAEELALSHTSTQLEAVKERLGITLSDGPYDGELPLRDCVFAGDDNCFNYRTLAQEQAGVDGRSFESTQPVEDFVYYAAYRNVVSGVYHLTESDEQKQYMENIGLRQLIDVEIYLLKNGEKKLSLFAGDPRFDNVREQLKLVYQQ